MRICKFRAGYNPRLNPKEMVKRCWIQVVKTPLTILNDLSMCDFGTPHVPNTLLNYPNGMASVVTLARGA
jgi:hypothetical protein